MFEHKLGEITEFQQQWFNGFPSEGAHKPLLCQIVLEDYSRIYFHTKMS